ncbi:uncharacterized protein LOC143861435 [Tasmannia lanceolata]|uniref:uncharacterized protein LOC143861435 n=1 Tax=Tasmannia lanceolata TaxID=3420 RepID=UPI004064583E
MNIITSWNIRGICSAAKKKEVQYLIRSTNAPICCLQETKAREPLMMHHVKDICESWDFHGNYEHVIKGRVWILWDPMRVNLQILSESSQFIHAEVLLTQTNQRFHLTTVYGRNYGGDRKVLWEDLELVNAVIQGPWIVLGDFNVIRSYDERSGGPSHNQNDIEDFNVMLPIARRKLEDIQNQLAQNPGDQRINKAEIEARSEFRVIARREGVLYKQKSRIEWLCQGDSNTKFFHAALLNRKLDQNIHTPKPNKFLTLEEANHLSREVTKEEIRDTVFMADGDKAPAKILKEINNTFISLIPKVPDAASPSKFQPISLCNFIYKTITKILAQRLKSVINKLVNPAQSAFIRGRQIQDNILLTHDILHKFHLASAKSAMCIKIDLAKAFDNVKREALLQFMVKQGFTNLWCKWVEECIQTPSFSVLINGSPQGHFNSTNGIHQGDPLSPLLFCLTMEMLSRTLEDS